MPDVALPSTLPEEINAATRTLHTTLNRLITSRLPLALPPHASDSTLYTAGLIHFSHVFLTFESLWTDLVSTPLDPPTSPLLSFLLVNPYDNPNLFSSPPSPQILSFLRHVRPKSLARSARLRLDLEILTGLHPTDLSVLLAQYPDEKVADFCAHIRKAVKQKPHVLFAYAWCFYMAIFSGGRWIRAQLINAGDDFWRYNNADLKPGDGSGSDNRGLAFWHFDGDDDGDDIKADFKRRLAAAETLFTADERVDVIEEAKEIFRLCASLVEELDRELGTDMGMVIRLERLEKKREREKPVSTVAAAVSQNPHTWLRRPEVTGAVVALGCLACVVLLKLDPKIGW